MREAHFHRCGEVDDDIVILRRLQYVQYGIAYLKGILRFRSRKRFGRILKSEPALAFLGKILYKLCSFYRYSLYLFFGFFKYLFTLNHTCRIVKMDDGIGNPLRISSNLANSALTAPRIAHTSLDFFWIARV